MIQTDINQYLKVQKLLASISILHRFIPLSSRLFLYKMSNLVLPCVRPDYFLKGIPSSPSFPPFFLLSIETLIFGLLVKRVELDKHAWKQIGRRRGESPNLYVKVEYGKEKARTKTTRNTLSPVFPDKQIIVTR